MPLLTGISQHSYCVPAELYERMLDALDDRGAGKTGYRTQQSASCMMWTSTVIYATYTVKFRDDALKEWLRLDKTIQQQFAKTGKMQ